MPEASTPKKKLQWKWVGISFLMYIILYLLPMVAVRELVAGRVATYLIGGWIFGGIVVVGAVAGFLSKGVTIWEPAIAGGAFICVYATSFYLLWSRAGFPSGADLAFLLLSMVIVFLLSLLGAWFGERAQNVFKPKTREPI